MIERTLRRYRPASSGLRRSGLDTISMSAMPERLRSMKVRPGSRSCRDLPASCSMCRRSMPTSRLEPSARSNTTVPSPTRGCWYWEIW